MLSVVIGTVWSLPKDLNGKTYYVCLRNMSSSTQVIICDCQSPSTSFLVSLGKGSPDMGMSGHSGNLWSVPGLSSLAVLWLDVIPQHIVGSSGTTYGKTYCRYLSVCLCACIWRLEDTLGIILRNAIYFFWVRVSHWPGPLSVHPAPESFLCLLPQSSDYLIMMLMSEVGIAGGI